MSTARSRRRRPVQSERRRKRSRRRNEGSDLMARVLAAVPAIAFAVFIIVQGGVVFTLGAMGLGLICLHELFRMYARLRPVTLAGFLGIIGLSLAAYDGDERQVMLALVAFFPVMFLIGLGMPERERQPLTGGMVITVLGVVWIGLAVAHAILLRGLPHGDAIIVDVLVATFVGDSGAYLGGRTFGTRKLAPRISPGKTVEGLAIGFVCAARSASGSPGSIRTGCRTARRCFWGP
jgi:phosphatidate cytidylyltransferase